MSITQVEILLKNYMLFFIISYILENWVATGETGNFPCIHIWNSKNLEADVIIHT